MNIYNVIILDESGSMSSLYDQALSGMNEVLSGIRKNREEFPDQTHFVTLVTFEGEGISGVKTRIDRAAIEDIQDLTRKDYCPGGCTPLYDAMGKTLNTMDSQIQESDRVMVTIITDGYENSSREYSGKTVKELVGRLRKKGWTFAYIGANQDAVEVAKELDINNALNYEATATGFCEMSVKLRSARDRFVHFCKATESCKAPTEMADLFDED